MRYLKKYNRDEFMRKIEKSAYVISTADDAGTVDWEFVRLQKYFSDTEEITDEHGGI